MLKIQNSIGKFFLTAFAIIFVFSGVAAAAAGVDRTLSANKLTSTDLSNPNILSQKIEAATVRRNHQWHEEL